MIESSARRISSICRGAVVGRPTVARAGEVRHPAGLLDVHGETLRVVDQTDQTTFTDDAPFQHC